MAALFGYGNSLSTPVGQLIERSTESSLASEDWALFMEICDNINETDEGPKDAVRAFKKRLSQNVGKNYTSVMYTLTCLETCVKNCGHHFHTSIATKDFLGELVKIIGRRYEAPQAVQEKVLLLFQTWSVAFRGIPELKECERVYQDMKNRGIDFPMTDMGHMAPIHTPVRSVPYLLPGDALPKSLPASVQSCDMPQALQPAHNFSTHATIHTVLLSPEQRKKLRRELDVVSGNVCVMSEMLAELSPTGVEIADFELLQELARTCRHMQQRVTELLSSVGDEDVLAELLRQNDDLNNVILRYERYRLGQRNSDAADSPATASISSPSRDKLGPHSDPNAGNLIDFLHSPSDANQSSVPGLAEKDRTPKEGCTVAGAEAVANEVTEIFSQSHISSDPPNYSHLRPKYANQAERQTAHNLRQTAPEMFPSPDHCSTVSDAASRAHELTSSEFDAFLKERANESVPNLSTTTTTCLPSSNSPMPDLKKKEDDENCLFAL